MPADDAALSNRPPSLRGAPPLRFGLVGYGAWGRHHAQAIGETPGAALVAVASPGEGAERARQELPGVAVYRDYRALLERPDVDVVDVVVPTDLHEAVGVAALHAGKDVLLEKPLAPTLEACDRLLRAARDTGRVLTVGHQLRFHTQWAALHRLVTEGALGALRYALVSLFRFPFRPGSGGWRHDPARVGSWILEEPVHFFDFLLWCFAGTGPPQAVMAVGHAPDGDPRRTRDVTAILRFPGGAHGVVTQTLGGFEYHQVVEVVGTEGAARAWWSGATDRTREPAFALSVRRRGQPAPEAVPVGPAGEVFALAAQLEATVTALRARRPVVAPAEARAAVAVALAAEQALREGREVPLTW